MLHTSILNRLCADLCNTVTEMNDGQAILESLEKSNLFIIPLDNTRRWYRYQHFFADMLRHRLEAQQPDLLPQLYRRAFTWHHKADLSMEAVHYALRGKLYTEAADVIEKIGHQTYWRNLAGTVGEWLQKLPASIIEMRPQLRIFLVLVLIDRGQIRAVEEELERLERYLARHPFSDKAKNLEFEGKIRAMQSAVAHHRYFDGAMGAKYADRALEILPETCPFDRCVAAFHGGGAYFLLGELDEARKHLMESLRLSGITGTPLDKMLAFSNLGKVELIAGNLDMARHYFSQTCKMATDIAVRQGSTFSDALTGLGMVYYLQNDLETAQTYLEQAIDISEVDEFLDRLLVAYVTLMRVHHSRGDVDQAAALLQHATTMMAQFNPPPNISNRLAVEQTRLWFIAGNRCHRTSARYCKICAEQCPSGAISFADSPEGMEQRGINHWYMDTSKCFSYWMESMGPLVCRLCITDCVYSRKNNWVHGIARVVDPVDPTGLANNALIWMQKTFFDHPTAEQYRRPPDGCFASYRPAPEWLQTDKWFNITTDNPQMLCK